MAQALKNLRVSRAEHQPSRVTRTGRILATIVALFQCVSHRVSFPSSEFYLQTCILIFPKIAFR